MYVKTENDATRRLHDAEVMPDDYVVEFSENNVAQVTEEVGNALINKYDSITHNE